MEHFGISECMGGGGKISMPPVVGVWIFSGTTHSGHNGWSDFKVTGLVLTARNMINQMHQMKSSVQKRPK